MVKLFADKVFPIFHGQNCMLVKWSGNSTSRIEDRPFRDSASGEERVKYSPVALIFRTVRNAHSVLYLHCQLQTIYSVPQAPELLIGSVPDWC